MQLYIIFLLIFLILLLYSFNNSKIIYESMNGEEGVCNNKEERALYLALKNSATLASLNDKIKILNNLDERFTKIENKVNINDEGIKNLTNKLSNYTSSFGNKNKIKIYIIFIMGFFESALMILNL